MFLLTSCLKTVLAVKSELASPKTPGSGKWPVTGGFQSQLSSDENIGVERIYIAGYQDGSVRIWNATFPVFSLIFTLELQVSAMGMVKNVINHSIF